MDLRQLRYFVAIADNGSVTAAAAALNISQPALSAQIHNLERELATDLLSRHSRGVEVTTTGRILLDRARNILADIDAVTRIISEQAASLTKTFRLGVTPTAGRVLLPQLAQLSSERLPDLKLSYVQGYSDDLREQLHGGKLDLAFSYDMDEDPALHVTPLLSEDLYLIGAPSLIGTETSPAGFVDLQNFPLIQEPQSHYTTQLLTRLATRNRITLQLGQEVDSVSVRRLMLASKSIATVAFYGLFHDEISQGLLNARRIVDPALTRRLDLVRKSDRPLDQRAASVEVVIREIIAEQVRMKTFRWREVDGA